MAAQWDRRDGGSGAATKGDFVGGWQHISSGAGSVRYGGCSKGRGAGLMEKPQNAASSIRQIGRQSGRQAGRRAGRQMSRPAKEGGGVALAVRVKWKHGETDGGWTGFSEKNALAIVFGRDQRTNE